MNYKINFVNFLQHSLETWKNEKTLTIIMSKETIENLVKELKGESKI